MSYVQEPFFFSLSSPFGADVLLLRSFHGEERISGLFRFSLECQSENRSLDFSQIIGKGVTITLDLADGSQRFLHGIVGRFVQAGSDERFATYYAEVLPWFWLLCFAVDCKIFQNKSVPEIAEAVFSDLGQTDFENRLTGTYTAREYCVQYNESAFDFVSRLLEDEGIVYFFEHADGKHTLVLADDPSTFPACPGDNALTYGTYGDWTQQNTVTACTLEQNVVAAAYALDDFNFETPSTDLVASVDTTLASGTSGEIYGYPGGFLLKDAGEGRAKRRIEERETSTKVLRGESYCRAFTSGHTFSVAGHYRDDVNASYALKSVSHRASREGYTNRFEAIPAATVYRPPLSVKKPVIPGTQTAIVVGKSGEEIWTDQYGRVKVQFHWDRVGTKDENSSCWIRVAHGWAGKGWGQIFLPRIGQEVVVSFLEGDPDRPLLTGSVYNAEQTVPYALPGEQTKSTVKSDSSKGSGGYNELRFEDKKDAEEVYFQAEKDCNRVVKNNDTLKVGFEKKDAGDQTIDVYNNRTVTLEEGSDKLQVKKGDRTVLVDTGNETHSVKGTRSITVEGDETLTKKANVAHTVDGNYTLTVKGDLTIDVTGKVTIKSGATMAIESGADLSVKAATTLDNEAGTALTNKSGTDLTNDAGTNLTNKAAITMKNQASASQTVDGGGMLELKGGLVKIN